MSPPVVIWRSDGPPVWPRITPLGWALVMLRGAALALWVFGGLGVHMVVRLGERRRHGAARTWSARITVAICRGALGIMGIGWRVRGDPVPRGILASNHVSWTDIFVLNALGPLVFVSKAEVRDWPGIGWLARATGTVFIRRVAREAAAQREALAARLRRGARLVLFAEGTSTDGRRVLPFKPALFGAFGADGMPEGLAVQPVTLVYIAHRHADPRFFGWWGDMGFADQLIKLLAAPRPGRVEVVLHDPIAATGDRKALARAAEAAVRSGLEASGQLAQA